MKLPHSPRGGRLLIGTLALIGTGFQAFADSKIPSGSLSVDSSLVRVGAQSQLGWQIQYPSRINDLVEVGTPPSLKPEKDLQMRVRVLGSSFQNVKNNNGGGNNVDGVDASNPGGNNAADDTDSTIDDEKSGSASTAVMPDFPVEVVWSKNNSEWSRAFYGLQSKVVPTAIVLNTKVAKGDTINFGARCYLNDGWLPIYSTVTSTPNVIVLKNGDSVPAFIPSYRLGQIKGYLKAYLSSDYKTVNIGENDFIVVMELDQSDPNDAGFDLQDLAVLVTFQ